jgi:tetratricopeptide (TPR) repeat protein
MDLNPDLSMPHTNMGSLYASLGRIESALKEFKLATEMNPGDGFAWYNLYNCYKDVGKTTEAQEAYKKFEALQNPPAAARKDASAEGVMRSLGATQD